MFYTMLFLTLAVAVITSIITALFFKNSITTLLGRIVGDEIKHAWQRYLLFAILVVGTAGGIKLWEFEKYIPSEEQTKPYVMTLEQGTLEIVTTFLDTLKSIAWMLLFFFIFSLVAYVIIRSSELRHEKQELKRQGTQ